MAAVFTPLKRETNMDGYLDNRSEKLTCAPKGI